MSYQGSEGESTALLKLDIWYHMYVYVPKVETLVATFILFVHTIGTLRDLTNRPS